jgi:hypothetical protein
MRWTTNPEVVVQRLGEAMVLVNLATDRILELNDTAATLFELVSSGLSEQEVEDRLVQLFEVGPDVVRGEIGALLRSLVDESVLIADAA